MSGVTGNDVTAGISKFIWIIYDLNGLASGNVNSSVTAIAVSGPDNAPAVSPDGERIAYLGFDDRYQGYQVTRLYVMDRDGTGSRALTATLDRSVASPRWAADGKGVFFTFGDQGNTKLGYATLSGDAADAFDVTSPPPSFASALTVYLSGTTCSPSSFLSTKSTTSSGAGSFR